jgi:multidrug resistance efflux pump
MSERAASDLRSLAAIRAQTLRLSLSWDAATKTLSKEYVNLYCPAPGADAAARAQLAKAADEKVETALPELRRRADLDHSGFVSSEEAGRFRQLVEFHWADAYLRETIGLSAQQVRATMGLSEADYRRLGEEYSALGAEF